MHPVFAFIVLALIVIAVLILAVVVLTWIFERRRKRNKAPRTVLLIPPDKLEEVLPLIDAYENGYSHLANYHLWEKIGEIYPSTKDGDWSYEVVASDRVEIREDA